MATGTEWSGVSSSNDLFGGDFFGDELMEMCSTMDEPPAESPGVSAAPLSLPPLAAEDDKSHPGLLIAMNAAAMDGGLSPFPVSSMTSVPSSDVDPPPPRPADDPRPPARPTVPAPAEATAPRALPPLPLPKAVPGAPGTAKRAAGAIVAPTAKGGPKKRKPAAVPRAKVAVTGGVKVALSPGLAHAAGAGGAVAGGAVARHAGRATSRPGGIAHGVKVKAPPTPAGVRRPPHGASLLSKKLAPVPSTVRSAAILKGKMPVGGISHQVVARPALVPSAATQRVATPPAAPPSAPAVAMLGKSPDLTSISHVTTASGSLRAKSEADFKDVATAAVSSLIQNASGTRTGAGTARTGIGTAKPPPSASAMPAIAAAAAPGERAVDVSTAHINALTSQNWITACNPVPAPEPSPTGSAAGEKAVLRNARRVALTQEERAKQNRDRNREHARNTRLRKKAYVEELKRTLTELVAQRDTADLDRRHEAQRNQEQREVRFRVMEEFLKIRGRNEPNASRWVAILEDGFAFSLPRTPFRRMADGGEPLANHADTAAGTPSLADQTLCGAAAVMEDSRYLAAYLQSIGGSAAAAGSSQVKIAYRCERTQFFMDGNVAFMDFDASTAGAVAKGTNAEAVFKGSMRASFSPASNKLISVHLQFDTAAFLQQVEAMRAASSAAAAANEADALLDSLQMPGVGVFTNNNDGVTPSTEPVSVSSDDGEFTDGSTALFNR